MSEKKYYWLKLKRDFFKRHDIRIIEHMENGAEIALFYLKLLCESVDHEGNLRFSDEIPYTESMLATITNTDYEMAVHALRELKALNMVKVLSDGTYKIKGVENMIGSAADNDNANRQRRFRERQKEKNNESITESVTKNNASVTDDVTKDNESKSKSIEIDKEKEKEKEREKKNAPRFAPPSVEEVRAYCEERKNKVDPERFVDFYASKNWYVGKNKMVDWKASVRTWEKRDNQKTGANGVKIADEIDHTLDGIL